MWGRLEVSVWRADRRRMVARKGEYGKSRVMPVRLSDEWAGEVRDGSKVLLEGVTFTDERCEFVVDVG